MQMTLCAESPIVAIVYDDDGTIYDRTYNWETGQVYANAGYTVQAVNSSGGMSVEECQELYDTEKRWAEDCFGPGTREP